MENLNIAEILKDCPSGTKLYSTIHGEVEFVDIYHNLIRCKCSHCVPFVNFYSNGRWVEHIGECVIFPSKDQRDWSKFHRPFEDGDILVNNRGSIFIYKGPMCYNKMLSDFYCGYRISDGAFVPKVFKDYHFGDVSECRFATEKEKQQLFDVIEDNGYKWNFETKALEKLIEPKFKVGNEIVKRNSISNSWIVSSVSSEYYGLKLPNGVEGIGVLPVSEQDDWELIPIVPKFKVGDRITNGTTSITIGYIDNEYYYEIGRNISNRLFIKNQDEWNLVPNKFDITTLKPFEQVLVRQRDDDYWKPAFWGRRITNKNFPFATSFGSTAQAIPFKNNEWLVGTAEDCNDYYKTW